MAYHDELLDQAFELVHREPENEASLRRAVSTAYYAVFHLLIDAACANWNRATLRNALSRAFDHSTMRAASNRIQNVQQYPYPSEDPTVVEDLRLVAKAFVQLREKRHIADYDNTTVWTKTDALAQVISARNAFERWARISEERIAQEYLISLIVKKRD